MLNDVRDLTTQEMDFVYGGSRLGRWNVVYSSRSGDPKGSGGYGAGGDGGSSVMMGVGYVLLGAGVAAALPFMAVGGLAAAGIAASAAVLGAGGTAVITLGLAGK